MTTSQTAGRERILAALADAVARDGYANAKVQEVARDAQVSLRTFYAEFTGKEQAFIELQRRVLDGLAQTLEDSASYEGTPRESIRHGFEVYFGLLTARPRLTTAITHELLNLSPEAREARKWARERFAVMLCNLVDALRVQYPDLRARSLSPLLANGVLGAIFELVTNGLVEGSGDSLDDLVDVGTDILWSVITNVEQAR